MNEIIIERVEEQSSVIFLINYKIFNIGPITFITSSRLWGRGAPTDSGSTTANIPPITDELPKTIKGIQL